MDLEQLLDSYLEPAEQGLIGNAEFRLLFDIVYEHFWVVTEKLGEIEKLIKPKRGEHPDNWMLSDLNVELSHRILRHPSLNVDEADDMGTLKNIKRYVLRAKEANLYLQRNSIDTYEDAVTFKEKFGGVPCIDEPLDELLGFEWQYKTGKIEQ